MLVPRRRDAGRGGRVTVLAGLLLSVAVVLLCFGLYQQARTIRALLLAVERLEAFLFGARVNGENDNGG